MLTIINNILTLANVMITRLAIGVRRDDVRSYFNAEYKKEANHAYEYWITTKKLNYTANS